VIEELTCFGCGEVVPTRYRECCSECGHTWRWGWRLSLADALVWWRLDRRLRIRRPSRVWVCPCCSHDL